jgi:hypothetical protein
VTISEQAGEWFINAQMEVPDPRPQPLRAKNLNVVPLPDFSDDALEKRALFYVLGRQFPDITEAVFIFESWIAPPSRVAPSEHPGREEAIILVGRNRDNTKGVFAKQVFTTEGKHIIWQEPDFITKPGSAEGLIDLIFAP